MLCGISSNGPPLIIHFIFQLGGGGRVCHGKPMAAADTADLRRRSPTKKTEHEFTLIPTCVLLPTLIQHGIPKILLIIKLLKTN